MYNSFKELEKEYSIPFSEEKYSEALSILENGIKSLSKEEFEKYTFNIIMDRAQFKSKLGLYDGCFKDLEFLIDKGYVCPLYWSRFSDPFIKRGDYVELREKNDLLIRSQSENLRMECEISLPENYDSNKRYPLFISLHGDGDSIEYHKEYWRADQLLEKGFIVAYLQSTQITSHKGYSWQDVNLYNPDKHDWPDSQRIHVVSQNSYWIKNCYHSAYDEIKNCYDKVIGEYSIDENKVIIGGFSGGAVASIDIIMKDIIPLKGFISLCSSRPNTFTEENVRNLIERGVKGVFMEGEKDIPVKSVDYMIESFENKGIPYEYYINEGIGHWYPEDLNEKLIKAVEFILE